MGNSGEDTSAKAPKSSPKQGWSTPNGTPIVFPDWASFQAYYNSSGTAPVPSAFYPSLVASSPQGHPYMWSPQHIMPPYGTPPPYVAMYAPGVLYPHPTIPPIKANKPSISDRPVETLQLTVGATGGEDIDGKDNGTKTSGASANGAASQSGESGSESSSEGSDANSQNGMQKKKCHEKNMASGGESMNVDATASETGGVSPAIQSPTVSNHISSVMAIPASAITAPSTTLNIGMDYWGGSSPASVNSFRSKLPITPCPAVVVSAHDAVPSDLSLQDEREKRRQKRKQSNRESARRSRLRKQAECEELALRASSLKEENDGLREELAKVKENCEKLASENASLAEKVKKLQWEKPISHNPCSQPEDNS